MNNEHQKEGAKRKRGFATSTSLLLWIELRLTPIKRYVDILTSEHERVSGKGPWMKEGEEISQRTCMYNP